LRGVAAISILIFHFKNFASGGGTLSRAPDVFDRIGLLQRLSLVREYGSWAVMLFWMLSGFVFMAVYGSTRPSARSFWVNRVARLYPLHLLTLLLIAPIQLWALGYLGHWMIFSPNDVSQFVRQLFFASAWASGSPRSFNGPIWSVSIEVLIYAVFFIYARVVPNNVATSLGGLIVFAALAKITHGAMVPVCGQFFFAGATIYAALYHCSADRMKLILLGALTSLTVLTPVGVLYGGKLPLSIWLLLIFGAIMTAAVASERLGAGRIYARAHALGDMTYSTYLWHTPLQLLFLTGAGLGLWSVDVAFSSVFLASYVMLVCLVGWLSFNRIELPAQKFVRRVLLSHRARPTDLVTAP